MAWIPKIHGVVRHRIHDFRVGRPERFDLETKVQELEQVVRARKSNVGFDQPRLEIFSAHCWQKNLLLVKPLRHGLAESSNLRAVNYDSSLAENGIRGKPGKGPRREMGASSFCCAWIREARKRCRETRISE